MRRLAELRHAVGRAEWSTRTGKVCALHGLAIESDGPAGQVGELCAIAPPGSPAPGIGDDFISSAGRGDAGALHDRVHPDAVLAEVVGIHLGKVTLMPYGGIQGLAVGSTVIALGRRSEVAVGDALLGRVIDCFGRPLDELPAPDLTGTRPLRAAPLNPMHRPPIAHCLETGVRGIDALLTLGKGQRTGIFAGSGVGKSTLLGMIARHVKADINVIALIGERGREVREFIEKQLGEQGLRRSVVVVATADQPALARIRAAHMALAISEYFCDHGRQVLLTMDSITRFAMARREVGLSAGEPPTARGYTPSVFAELPALCERCGCAASGGSITALLTVLVEGDDFNEPVSDALRAILDGHIVLSREIAHQGRYPAIDFLKSASRLLPSLATPAEREKIRQAMSMLALLERSRPMVELGAYEKAANPKLDGALACEPALQAWLCQEDGGVSRSQALGELSTILARLSEETARCAADRSPMPSAFQAELQAAEGRTA